MRSFRWFVLIISSSVAFLSALAQTPQAPPANRIDKVKDDLYVISGDGGNTTVFVTDEGLVLVDDKFDRDYDDILAKIKTVSDKPVKYIFNTHPHPDHTGGNQKFPPSVIIIGHTNNPVGMARRKAPAPPTVTFSEEMAITLGGKQVLARHTGNGHTDADLMVYFPSDKVLAAGDLFNTGTFGVYIDYAGGGSLLPWPKTLEGFLKWDFDTVVPGHGPLATRADFIKSRADVESTITRITGMVREGKTKEDVTKVLIGEFGWNPAGLGIRNSVEGLMAELKK